MLKIKASSHWYVSTEPQVRSFLEMKFSFFKKRQNVYNESPGGVGRNGRRKEERKGMTEGRDKNRGGKTKSKGQ